MLLQTLACKVYREQDGERYLEAVNGHWPRIPPEQFRVIGMVVKVMRDV